MLRLRTALLSALVLANFAIVAERAWAGLHTVGSISVTLGPNKWPSSTDPDQFRSHPDATHPSEEVVWTYAIICCTTCTCDSPMIPGLQYNGTFSVTGSSGTTSFPITFQSFCACCNRATLQATGHSWGPPATGVTVSITAWCICCMDGNPVTAGTDYTVPVSEQPTPTAPDPGNP